MVKKYTDEHEWIEMDDAGKIGQSALQEVNRGPCSINTSTAANSLELSNDR